jgi:hypothetical protein
MPQLDYAVLAEYVRQDGGMVHIMGAGIDTFNIPADSLPTAVPVGLALRITFSSRDSVGVPHEINATFTGPGEDDVLLTMTRSFAMLEHPADIPGHWRPALNMVVRIALPIPVHGNYALTVTLDDDPEQARRIDLRAVDPRAQPAG